MSVLMMKCKHFAVAQRAARASQGVAGCLALGCYFGSHTCCLEMYLRVTYGREAFKAPCKKRVETPQWTGQQVRLEAQHKGTLSPASSQGARILPGPLHPGSVCSFTHDQGREELSLSPPRDSWPRRGCPASIPSCFPFLGVPPCSCLARWL